MSEGDPEPVARRELVGVAAEGERFTIRLLVYAPLSMGDANDNWRCPVAVEPFHPRRDIYGVDSLQALTLGLRFAHDRLLHFVEGGGRLFFPDSDDELKLSEAAF